MLLNVRVFLSHFVNVIEILSIEAKIPDGGDKMFLDALCEITKMVAMLLHGKDTLPLKMKPFGGRTVLFGRHGIR